MNTDGVPSCQWPDEKGGATFRNCFDEEGRVDKTKERHAALDRIEAITRQLDCPNELTDMERRALGEERRRFQQMFALGDYVLPRVIEMDARKDKATEKKLRWFARKIAAQNNSQDR